MRLITRGGYNWTDRYPWIVEAVLKNRHKQFVIDGEAVILGIDGVSDFDALHSGRHNDEVQLYAFLALDGDDLRKLPLTMRKTNLARLLARRPRRSRQARSVPIYSALPAVWVSKDWSASTVIARIVAAAAIIGSRSRTRTRRRQSGRQKSIGDDRARCSRGAGRP